MSNSGGYAYIDDIVGPFIADADVLVCLGHDEDLEAQSGALAPPVVFTSLFAQADFDELVASLDDEYRARIYTRGNNPTVQAVEQKIAALEGGETCRCVASGMAAVRAVFDSCLEAGDHILFAGQTYGPTLQLARRMQRFGIEHTLVAEVDETSVAKALQDNTRLLWMESPSTMVFQTFDMAALVDLAHSHQSRHGRPVVTAVDNSWASPLFQKPIHSGVDLVVHSATKYIGGHSDVVAGAVVGSHQIMEPLFHDAYLLGGAALGPMEAWLLNRGLRTLPARMARHHASGLELARFLDRRSEVARVHHPGLEGEAMSHAERPRGLSGFSGLFSFELDLEGGDRTADFGRVRRFLDALRRFRIGVRTKH